MKRWIELTDEYVKKIKHMALRKIRLQNGDERWAHWDKEEGCFFCDEGETAFYIDEMDRRPSHILMG